MNRHQIRELIMLILYQADYDLAKSYDPETAEEPEYATERMDELISLVHNDLEAKTIKTKKVK